MAQAFGPYRQQNILTDSSQAEVALVTINVPNLLNLGTVGNGAFLLEGRVTAWNGNSYSGVVLLAGRINLGLGGFNLVNSQPVPYIYQTGEITARFATSGGNLILLGTVTSWVGDVYWYGQVTMTGRSTY